MRRTQCALAVFSLMAVGVAEADVLLSVYSNELAAVRALGELTNAPSIYLDESSSTPATVGAGEMKAVFFDALDYTGSPTRVYAYIGIPAGASSGNPAPGVVLVHGGGGTAYRQWVEKWIDHGYAAISIAVEGQTDVLATQEQKDAGLAVGNWLKHAMPGPARVGIYGDSTVDPIEDQWMYHAAAGTVLANSLLRSLPEVRAEDIGVMGVSWGGVITSTAIGIDTRFRFAVPTYGCGNKSIAENIYGTALGGNDLYKEVWDPLVRIGNATMPVLWFSWPQEWHFPLNCQRDTYAAAPGTHMVSLVPDMKHGHAAAWNRPESYAFADSIISNAAPWCVQQSVSVSGNTAEAVFNSSKPLSQATVISTLQGGLTGDRTWNETAATLVDNGGGSYTVTTTLPQYTTAWFINVLSGSLVASSDYQETDILPPSNIVYDVTANWSSKTVNGNDNVTINNGAVISLDQTDDALALTVNDDASATSTLLLNQNVDLTINGGAGIELGAGTGAGIVTQSTGTVTTESLTVNSSGTGNLSQYNLSGGSVAAGSVTVNNSGEVNLTGGTLKLAAGSGTLNIGNGGAVDINGGMLSKDLLAPSTNSLSIGTSGQAGGLVQVQAGGLQVTNGLVYGVINLRSKTEISGGDVDLEAQVRAWNELKVIGDAAAINVGWLGTYAGSSFVFEPDATGISPINVAGWMSLANATIRVDGSAYTGGANSILLLDSANLTSPADAANISVYGFARHGLEASVVQQQAPGHWVQLVLAAHTPATVTYAASANWSSKTFYGNDNVVIGAGVTVAVDTGAFAGSLQVDGTLRMPLGIVGFSPMNLIGGITVGTGGSIAVDGTAYEGFDGYFPLILASNLADSLTNQVSFTGFGAREPAVIVEDDGLWLRLIAPPALSERLCSLVPESTVAIDWSNTVFSATREYDPSGSAWSLSLDEAHVLDTTLVQTSLTSLVRSWELRTGRGGNIYSLRTPALGETVPPSYRSDGDSSPWNDEVWQGVAVSSLNDAANTNHYFMHQSGVYLRDPDVLSEPFYSPQVASHLNESARSFTTINWTPQAHVNIYMDGRPENDWKSYLLMYTRYRDLGQGVIEVSLGYYNYGPDRLVWFDTPWGGVRRTSTEYAFVADPGGTTWSEPITNGWGTYLNFNQTGGWIGTSATSNGVTPAFGLVVGKDAETLLPDQTRESMFGWGYAGTSFASTNETSWRNYLVTTAVRRYNLTQGKGFWSRHYFTFGDDMQDLSDRIADRNLVEVQLRPFDYAEPSTPLVAYSVSGSGANFQIVEDGRSPDFFLYAYPINNSVPLFEIIERDESRYLTWNPYANGIVKPYDGTLAGIRLLGFAMPSSGTSGTTAALGSLLPPANYLADGKTLFARTATPIQTWRVEYFGLTDNAGDGANAADPDGDGVVNLLEYGLGGNPTNAADIGHVPRFGIADEGGTNFFEYTYPRRTTFGHSLIYTVESTDDLVQGSWTNSGAIEIPATGTLDFDFEAVTKRIDTTGKTNEFIRLRIDAL